MAAPRSTLLTYVGLDRPSYWKRATGTTSAGGVATINLGQGNGTKILAVYAYKTSAAPTVEVISVSFGYQGGIMLPSNQFQSYVPVPADVGADPVPVGLDIEPAQQLNAYITGGDATSDYTLWVLFDQPSGC